MPMSARKGSLTFDLEQGRRLEVDWLSGAACRQGEAAGIDTPFHRVALGVLKPHTAIHKRLDDTLHEHDGRLKRLQSVAK